MRFPGTSDSSDDDLASQCFYDPCAVQVAQLADIISDAHVRRMQLDEYQLAAQWRRPLKMYNTRLISSVSPVVS